MENWFENAFVYHIYPLGLCGAPQRNSFYFPISYRLDYLHTWIQHLKEMGVTAVCIGPLFESSSHGYDTIDYYHVDRRLGDRNSLRKLVESFHNMGIKVIFDAVFNHVGREFWAFKDVLKNGRNSWYCDWFDSLKFGERSPLGDPFTYKTWKKHYSLVKLNLKNKYVKEHLFKAVEMWINELGVDGLRLDAADCLKTKFITDLKKYSQKIKKDFILLGEIVHGDYRKKVTPKKLDTVTNYQRYRQLHDVFKHKNFKELAEATTHQSGKNGVYKNISLYSFADNHDVNRIASQLKDRANLYPLYALLFTLPGVPSIYYGSEFGISGKRTKYSDQTLRPYLNLSDLYKNKKYIDLLNAIKKFSFIRQHSKALKYGDYLDLFVGNEIYCFLRKYENEVYIVIVSSSNTTLSLDLKVPFYKGVFTDVLNNNEIFYVENGNIKIKNIYPNWSKILKLSMY
jgi:cyclomaltodextrinase